MKSIISVPQDIITGIFNVRIACSQAMPFTRDDVQFVTIAGDALGGRWVLTSAGASHQIVYYIPDNVQGESEVRCADARSVRIKYDTYRSVSASFGVPVVSNRRVVIPVTFGHTVVGLSKRAFRVSADRVRTALYGSGRQYELVIESLASERRSMTVDIVKQVCKETMVLVDVDITARGERVWL